MNFCDSTFFDFSSDEFHEANKVNPIFTSRNIFEDTLLKIGIFEGIQVVVHCSLSSLGVFENGASNCCQALMNLVTPNGTLLMPELTRYPEDGEEFIYDARVTPCRVGAVAEVFRTLPGVVRSYDPTHSFAAWGRDKIYFVKNHHKYPTMHSQSPLGLLEQVGGYALMIGCREAVTFMHVVEYTSGAHCLGVRNEEYPAILPDGRRVNLRGWGWRSGICPALNHDKIYNYMRKHDTLSEVMLGRCHLMLFKLKDYRKAYQQQLNDEIVGCKSCSICPRKVKQNVLSDWDSKRDCLLPSKAFTGDIY